jgi:NAD(P)-dependent dehydrogenase (short-subunit alcohol dehydrogenase family)
MNKRDIHLVVVTGAGSGIGRATALRFAGDGAEVVCLDIDEATARDTAAVITERGGRARGYRLDVSDADAYEELAAAIAVTHGVPDVVVNNAGIVSIGGTLTHTVEDWRRVLGVNLTGVVHGCRLFGAPMSARGEGGHIVNIGSLASYTPTVAGPSYCTSKAGVRMLSESLRAELASEGIGVSVICPGGITTNLWGSADHLGVGAEETDDRNALTLGFATLALRLGAMYPPDSVAKAVVRSVHHNWAVVPVRPEAWVTYALSRLSPELLRLGVRLTGEETVETLVRLAERSPVTPLVRRAAGLVARP